MTNPVVTGLHVYPVKSCRGVPLMEATLTDRGLADDRLFQVVDDAWLPITQRQQPQLATVRPHVTTDGLRLEADDVGVLEIERPTTNDVTASSLLGIAVEAADAGDAAAQWFSNLLGVTARLVALTDESDAHLPLGGVKTPLSWADAAPALVANDASLDWLVDRAAEPFGMDRFRPNITVGGAAPWVEDTWSDFSIGDAGAMVPLPWPRCAIPQVDQVSGARHKEPAVVLKAHRWCATADVDDEVIRGLLEGNALFGVACALGPAGTVLRVGDEVTVRSTAQPLLPPPT